MFSVVKPAPDTQALGTPALPVLMDMDALGSNSFDTGKH